jgi:hypothetical protein
MITNKRRQGLHRGPAAAYVRETYGLECSQAYLEKLASLDGGPLFYRVGRRVEYDPADLDCWALSRISGPVRKASDYLTDTPAREPSHLPSLDPLAERAAGCDLGPGRDGEKKLSGNAPRREV